MNKYVGIMCIVEGLLLFPGLFPSLHRECGKALISYSHTLHPVSNEIFMLFRIDSPPI